MHGKTIENLRNRIDVSLVSNAKIPFQIDIENSLYVT